MDENYVPLVRRSRRLGYDIAIQTQSPTGFPVTAAWSWALTRRGAQATVVAREARRRARAFDQHCTDSAT